MKTTIRMEDVDGNLLEEKEIVLTDSDQLVLMFSDFRLWNHFQKVSVEVLEKWEKAKVLILAPGMDIKVLRKIDG